MCLALPGKILSIDYSQSLPMAEVDFSGVTKPICIVYTPKAQVGDYVIVHVGFAITKLNEQGAQDILDIIET